MAVAAVAAVVAVAAVAVFFGSPDNKAYPSLQLVLGCGNIIT